MKQSRNKIMVGFWVGVLTTIACESLIQDAMGRDAFVQYVQTHWVAGWVSVPIAIVALVVAVALYVVGGRETGKR